MEDKLTSIKILKSQIPSISYLRIQFLPYTLLPNYKSKLIRKRIFVHSLNDLKPINALVGQNSEFLKAKACGGTLGSSYN
jgi:hypothetical protein